MPRRLTLLLLTALVAAATFLGSAVSEAEDAKLTPGVWVSLFNGQDLTGWTPKIKGYELGDNYGDTFRVEEGVLQVRFDKYEGPYRGRFGHLFYKDQFSHYRLRVEYRFVGEQVQGGPGWALRNSGVMIHGQKP